MTLESLDGAESEGTVVVGTPEGTVVVGTPEGASVVTVVLDPPQVEQPEVGRAKIGRYVVERWCEQPDRWARASRPAATRHQRRGHAKRAARFRSVMWDSPCQARDPLDRRGRGSTPAQPQARCRTCRRWIPGAKHVNPAFDSSLHAVWPMGRTPGFFSIFSQVRGDEFRKVGFVTSSNRRAPSGRRSRRAPDHRQKPRRLVESCGISHLRRRERRRGIAPQGRLAAAVEIRAASRAARTTASSAP